MKIPSIYIFACITMLSPALTAGTIGNHAQPISIEDIFVHKKFALDTILNPVWAHDSSGFFFMRRDKTSSKIYDIYKHDLKTGHEAIFIKGKDIKFNSAILKINAYEFTSNNEYLLITSNKKKIWKYSYSAAYYLYRLSDGKIIPLSKGEQNLVNVKLSPNGQSIAFVQNNNLFRFDIQTNKITQLTYDGSDNILNGLLDWVYEEEFAQDDAYHWSPDSSKIVFWRTDQNRVKAFTLLDELPQYSQSTVIKYPKAGEQNATIKIGVVNIENRKITWVKLKNQDDFYIPRINWIKSSNSKHSNQLLIQYLNREQNHLKYLFANAESGKIRTITQDKSKAWIDIRNDTTILETQDGFIWTSEKSGYRHIYFTHYKNGKTKQITNGQWEVSSVIGADEKNNWVYFYGKKNSVIEKHCYRVSLINQKIEKISQELGSYSALFSPDYRFYLQFASSINIPTQYSLRSVDGSMVRTLINNEISRFDEYKLSHPEFITIDTKDGLKLHAQITKPLHFNPKKQYPVIAYAYGGPGSQRITNRWPSSSGAHAYDYFLAQQGYILFKLDNRGTGGRGTKFKHYAYGDISKWAVEDQIEGVQYLRTLSYVDPSNIGFWGKSFGGYMAGMLMTRASDYYSTGIALAMVSNFYNYDTIWTERYMGLPRKNKAGYEAANVLNYTAGLKGNLLLVHGSGDDNVHPQNTIQLADKLIKENKQFELMIYPNNNHSLNGQNTKQHLYTLMTNFFNRHLMSDSKN